MPKRFVRVDLPPDEDGDGEIILLDLARVSMCEISTSDDGSEWYSIFDAAGVCVLSVDVNHMLLVVEAVEQAARNESWGDVPD